MKSFLQPRRQSGALLVGVATLVLSTLILVSCGDTFRPVANPVPGPGGDPQAQHIAVVLNNNAGGLGTTTQVNVSGDTNVGNFTVGHNPVHALNAQALGRVIVANKGDDSLSLYTPTSAGSTVSVINLPPGSAPVFVQSVGVGDVFVAGSNPGACGNVATVGGCVYTVNVGTAVLDKSLPVGHNPVMLVGTPDGARVYVINQGDGTVTPIATADFTVSAPITVGLSPVWAAMKSDGSTLYVANQGSNTVSVIDVATNTVTATLPVGPGPRFLAFDNRLRRLYVANTGGNTISVFSADVTPTLLSTVTVGANPTSLTALADGTRVYVSNAGCQDRLDLTTPCTGNTVSVVDTASLTVRKTVTVGTGPAFLDSSSDSVRVVVANRDSNNISSIRTSDDTVVNTLTAASPTPLFVTITR